MPIVRHITNKSGAEGFAVGLTPKDLFMLRQHGMCQIDVRTFATGVSSLVLILGETEEQILNIIDPNQKAVVVNTDKPLADALKTAVDALPASKRKHLNGTGAASPLPLVKDDKK